MNQDELEDGSEFHGEHWLRASSAGGLSTAAWILLLIALVILGIHFGLKAAG
ncbi:hypothetical protein Pelsub_P0164 [Pelolinea submarina]|nr:hypothetical protein Pelsub_P0164 [Pelolinea submarina]